MRRFGIGSSDAALVHGNTAFGRTAFDLFAELKDGGKEMVEGERDDEENFRMHLGNALEPAIMAGLSALLQEQHNIVGLLAGPSLYEAPFSDGGHLFSRPDAYHVADDEVFLCEGKVVTVYGRAAVVGNNAIPENYLFQGLHHIAVAQAKWPGKSCRLFYGFYDLVNFESKYLEFVYDQQQVDQHVERCYSWWEDHVTKGNPPPIFGDNSGKLAAAAFPSLGFERETQPDEAAVLSQVAQLKALEKQIEEKLKLAEGELRQLMMIRRLDKVWAPEVGSYSYKPQNGRTSFDKEKFAQSYPGVYEKFTKQGAMFRASRFTPAKAKKEG
jgi:predicted phage-related endonuclease